MTLPSRNRPAGPTAEIRRQRTALAATAVLLPLLLLGCGKKNMENEWKTTSSETRLAPTEKNKVKGAIQFMEPKEFHEGVGLRAIADGSRIAIFLLNARKESFYVRPTDFAVIVQGRLYRAQPGKADLRQFPPFEFVDGASAAGVIDFVGMDDLAGARLVFNNPQIGKPFYVPIEGAGEAKQ